MQFVCERVDRVKLNAKGEMVARSVAKKDRGVNAIFVAVTSPVQVVRGLSSIELNSTAKECGVKKKIASC
jgi:hypothetical protein